MQLADLSKEVINHLISYLTENSKEDLACMYLKKLSEQELNDLIEEFLKANSKPLT
jgi:hypothetical protein